MKIKTLSVSELNIYIKKVLDNDFLLRNISVKGEISNLKYHSSGHIYFTLKDTRSRIACVMFRAYAKELAFTLKEGMSITASGRISVYEGLGSLQLYVQEAMERGTGDLYQKFERLKKKLGDCGLFDEDHKLPLPQFPTRVGVITSKTGAVFHDIINVTKRRNSHVDIVLYPARVQGDMAYKEIIEGLKYFNKNKNVDVVIVGRGGGSIEELWNFNEEELAVYIYKSKIPVISAVGHEVDYTICDFVADKRAATPSQAAEIAVPLEENLIAQINDIKQKLFDNMISKLQFQKNYVNSLNKELSLKSPSNIIANNYLLIDKLKNALDNEINKKIAIEQEKLNGLNKLLIAKNPTNILSKGYAIIEDSQNKNISSVTKLNEVQDIKIILKDGSAKGKFIPALSDKR